MKRSQVLLTIGVVFALIIGSLLYFYFTDVGEFGEDYWFEGDTLKTKDGWTFKITEVAACDIECVALAVNVYHIHDFPSRPINTFSPLDIWIGVDDVRENTSDYDYEVRSYDDRHISWSLKGDNFEYFRAHTGNTHIVPHNKEVAEAIMTIEEGDKLTLEGYFVNFYGTKDDKTYEWTTDTTIGNYDCEIILLDYLKINSSVYGNHPDE